MQGTLCICQYTSVIPFFNDNQLLMVNLNFAGVLYYVVAYTKLSTSEKKVYVKQKKKKPRRRIRFEQMPGPETYIIKFF